MTGPEAGPEGSAEALRLAAKLTTAPAQATADDSQPATAEPSTPGDRDAQIDHLLQAQADLQTLVAVLASRTDEHDFAIGRLQSATFDTA